MQSAEIREVRLLVEQRKLLDGPVPCFVGRFAGEGEVADLTTQYATGEFFLNRI